MLIEASLHYLYQLQGHGIRPGLARTRALLTLLDHPEKSFRSIHIGGTNGKGSTAAMLASVLEQSGYQVGLYTSPHLIDFSERIRICGQAIPKDAIVHLTETIRHKMEAQAPHLVKNVTFFEFTTAMAFLYFAESKVDLAVVEVGMGGQLDATNTLMPIVTAITQIGFDHERYLGTTLREIAREKAGILKEGVPIVSGASQPEVCDLIEEIARSKHAPLFRLGKEIAYSLKKDRHSQIGVPRSTFCYSGIETYRIDLNLLGQHQITNACVAIGIIELLQSQGIDISKSDIVEGLHQVSFPGRLEVVRTKPLLLLDVAHNPSGGEALGHYLIETEQSLQGKSWLIFGAMQDKKINKILEPLCPRVDEFVFTQAAIQGAANPKKMASDLIRSDPFDKDTEHFKITVQKKVENALSYVESRIQPQDRLVITGSCFTVGEARAALLETRPSFIRG